MDPTKEGPVLTTTDDTPTPGSTSAPRVPQTLTGALLALQARLPELVKGETATVATRTGGSYSYAYIGLPAVSRALLPMLVELGCTWTCAPTLTDSGAFVLRYRLGHVSGEEIAGNYPLPTGGSPQEIGSAITYARRYALLAVVGACADQDDDAVMASGRRTPSRPRRTRTEQDDEPRLITEPQGKLLHKLLGDAGMTKRDGPEGYLPYLTSKLGRQVTTTKALTAAEAGIAIDLLQQALAESHEETPGGVA